MTCPTLDSTVREKAKQNLLCGDVIKMASLLQAARVPLLWALFVCCLLVPLSIVRMCTLTKNGLFWFWLDQSYRFYIDSFGFSPDCSMHSRLIGSQSSPSHSFSSPSASASYGQVLQLVWCKHDAKMYKKFRTYSHKSLVHKSRVSQCMFHGSRKNRKPVSRRRKNAD